MISPLDMSSGSRDVSLTAAAGCAVLLPVLCLLLQDLLVKNVNRYRRHARKLGVAVPEIVPSTFVLPQVRLTAWHCTEQLTMQ
jgi:hypothetical protein